MTVYDFCNLCIDDSAKVKLYDLNHDTVVFEGTMAEAQLSRFDGYEIESFDEPDGITMCLNICVD